MPKTKSADNSIEAWGILFDNEICERHIYKNRYVAVNEKMIWAVDYPEAKKHLRIARLKITEVAKKK